MPDTTTVRPRFSRPLLVLALLSLLFTLISGASVLLSESPQAQGEAGLASRGEIYTVERVIDGDTIEVDRPIQGEDNVRLIGMDTPETFGGEEPLGPEATSFTTDRLEGEQVALEFDQERIDQYGRPLAYVWDSPNRMHNQSLLGIGLAQVATFPPNTRYEESFIREQEAARAAELGIWGLSAKEQCQLADRGNGIGEGSPQCTQGEEPEQASEEPEGAAQEAPAANASPDGADPAQSETTQPEREDRAGEALAGEPRAGEPRTGSKSPEQPGASGLRASRTPDTGGPVLLPLAGAMMTAGFAGLLVSTRLRR